MSDAIPFNKPFIVGNELTYIERAVRLGNIAGDGEYTAKCAAFFEQQYGIPRILMTPSATAALEMAAILCDLGPGDEVIMPSFTFVSTASAVVRCDATPVFVDIASDTLNLDAERIESAITSRTKAIWPVHYGGVACQMDTIMEIARRHDLLVVEDAAQGVGASYRDQPLGSIGDLGAYSFHETKNIICGEGGALCINRPDLIARAEIIRDKGTNRKEFFRGSVDKYSWVDIGSSYVPNEISCAFLYAQLEQINRIHQRRQEIYERYWQAFADLEADQRLRRPWIPSDCQSSSHMFYLLLPDNASREALRQHLVDQGIRAVIHYVPLHSSKMGQQVGRPHGDLYHTTDLSDRLLRLPMYFELSHAQQDRVIDATRDFFESSPPG
ncbi:MAG: dTDP-4-amino-4,6-dideoxygalactose transaminase [Blastopirellula sp.]|nr:dTDP-4-amino-4,6-dideoxygalactose transaminase [Blastopirellula sp.]